jgi:glycosyltransferase involved in cell wall biosynthesis
MPSNLARLINFDRDSSMSDPLVSIITPVYNGEQYLLETIESALAQTYKNFELLIVNDGSTDNSAAIIKPFLKDSRVIYIEQKNAGVAAARNTAIKQARGKYIGFLDQDDLWLSNKLEVQIAVLEQDESIALVHSRQDFIDSQGNKIDYDWVTGVSGYCFEDMFKKNRIAVLTVLIRKTIFDEIGLFNEKFSGADDYHMWLRVTIKHPISYIDQALAFYRFHDSNWSKNSFRMTAIDVKVIDTILFEYPQALKLAGKQTVRARLYTLNHQLGGWYSWFDQNYHQGRKHYWRAILNNPFSWIDYYRFIYCSLSKEQRKALSWYLSKLKNILPI